MLLQSAHCFSGFVSSIYVGGGGDRERPLREWRSAADGFEASGWRSTEVEEVGQKNFLSKRTTHGEGEKMRDGRSCDSSRN
jgi:hypothetical protein